MKKFIVLSLLGAALSAFALFEVNIFDIHHLLGKCTGSDYCRICTNCSRCGYCKGGGTCGVCYTPRAIVRRSAPAKISRSGRSANSSRSHSFDSSTPAVKRHYKQKISSPKYSSTKISASHKQFESESFSGTNEATSALNSEISSPGKTTPAENPQSIYSEPDITEEKESYTIEIPENANFVRITASSAHLREQFTTKSRIIQTLNHGDLLIRIKSVKGWVKVQALDSGQVGYVFSSLLK